MRLKVQMLAVPLAAAALATSFLVAPSAGANPAHAAKSSASTIPACIINTYPKGFVETGLAPAESSVAFVFEVECKAEFSENKVQINSTQLSDACNNTLSWYSATANDGTAPGTGTGSSFDVVLDNDGNATAVVWGGPSCAAGKDLVTADLQTAPFTTAKTYATIKPPVSTAKSLKAYPAEEVEDSNTSSVATIFYAEFPSVYSERTVTFSDAQLSARCTVTWVGADETVLGTGASANTTLDDNGNAFVVALAGPSCATGETLAEADLVGAPNTTLTTKFEILSPRVTDT